jgi:hypothetical protein
MDGKCCTSQMFRMMFTILIKKSGNCFQLSQASEDIWSPPFISAHLGSSRIEIQPGRWEKCMPPIDLTLNRNISAAAMRLRVHPQNAFGNVRMYIFGQSLSLHYWSKEAWWTGAGWLSSEVSKWIQGLLPVALLIESARVEVRKAIDESSDPQMMNVSNIRRQKWALQPQLDCEKGEMLAGAKEWPILNFGTAGSQHDIGCNIWQRYH